MFSAVVSFLTGAQNGASIMHHDTDVKSLFVARSELERRAVDVAVAAHAGAVDKGGRPYVEHPLRVAARLAGETERTVALLHDVVEDSGVSLADLAAAGFSPEVVLAVDALSRREGEAYAAYLERVVVDGVATRVKLADLAENMDLSRIPVPTERDTSRVRRYERARAFLLSRWGGTPED
jgi:GTP diphosphokinase / guanosine-3',5'-bis(diphosphate) 3'-diphosphatase